VAIESLAVTNGLQGHLPGLNIIWVGCSILGCITPFLVVVVLSWGSAMNASTMGSVAQQLVEAAINFWISWRI
jgi:hypothetical protein